MTVEIKELCEKLQSNERRPKIGALEDLQHKCEDNSISTDDIFSIFDECYLHLLKCYSDRYESVRDQAVQTVSAFIQRLPPNDFHMLNVIGTLTERLGQQETVEDSEEIRLLYVMQLKLLMQRFIETGKGGDLQESYATISRILAKALRDAYPSVQKEACTCVVVLAKSAEAFTFQAHTEQLAKALYGMLNHKHSSARIAAVEALGRIALHMNASNETLSQLIMEVSPLLMDSMPLVRRECGELGILLLLELRDRYSYFERIIPLVLCCLKDDSPEVINYIRPKWVQCGKLYYDENETELSKKELADIKPKNYPEGVQRPTIGCRGVVQRSLRLLKLITRESSDWKDNVRVHSLKLLYQFVLHAEAAMTAKFFEIYADVARSCRDCEAVVANEAYKVSDLMGRLLSYADWCEHGFEGLQKNANEGYLKCFYYMFTSSLGPNLADILRFSKILICPEFSQTLKPEFQLYVLKSVQTLLEKSKELKEQTTTLEESTENLKLQNDSYEELHANLYVATIKVMALCFDVEQANAGKLQEMGTAILETIAQRVGITVNVLHEKCFSLALSYVENLDALLDGLTEPILLLHGLLSIARFHSTYLEQLQDKIKQVWENCADDAKVKIFSAISIAMLHWSSTVDKEVHKSVELLEQFLTSVVEPHLVWQAGANAEVMRSLATATLCSMSQGAPKEARMILPTFAKYMTNLLEDHSVATRHYAVKCMMNFGELPVSDMKPIAYATLQRLDDPSADIRRLAAMAIPLLRPKFEKKEDKEVEYELGIWDVFIKTALDMMFLHYEGPEARLKAAIKDSIFNLANKHPQIAKDSFKRTLALSYNVKTLKMLEDELPLLIS